MKKEIFYILLALIFVLAAVLLCTILSNVRETTEDLRPQIKEQPRAAVTPQGNVTFCFRLNGREDMHLPALLGAAGDDVYPNGLAGFNWSLTPGSSGSEPYGVLADGTIFIKKHFLSQWDPNKVELKADKTGWKPVEMEEAEVDGDLAYVYK